MQRDRLIVAKDVRALGTDTSQAKLCLYFLKNLVVVEVIHPLDYKLLDLLVHHLVEALIHGRRVELKLIDAKPLLHYCFFLRLKVLFHVNFLATDLVYRFAIQLLLLEYGAILPHVPRKVPRLFDKVEPARDSS